MTKMQGRGIAALRIALGAGFLYAGLEKVLHLAGTGAFSAAGFLTLATGGALPGSDATAIVNPTHDFWVSLAATPGRAAPSTSSSRAASSAIGLALILGLATRFAGLAGGVMMGLFYVANWSFATGPFNEQFLLRCSRPRRRAVSAGEYYGLDALIEKTHWFQRTPTLRYVLG